MKVVLIVILVWIIVSIPASILMGKAIKHHIGKYDD